MRATSGPTHKALVEVAGTTLLEHNLLRLLCANITDVVVVISAHEPAIEEYLTFQGAMLARHHSAKLKTFIETTPLGNIGAVRAINDGEHDLYVVYVDNLTSIAPNEVLQRHRDASAAMTITTHFWPLKNPFGELDIEAGYVRGYREKPTRSVRISSGTCVVGPAAAELAPTGAFFGAAQLCAAVLAASLPIAAFQHDELWIDVNDARALSEAEALVRLNPQRFQS